MTKITDNGTIRTPKDDRRDIQKAWNSWSFSGVQFPTGDVKVFRSRKEMADAYGWSF